MFGSTKSANQSTSTSHAAINAHAEAHAPGKGNRNLPVVLIDFNLETVRQALDKGEQDRKSHIRAAFIRLASEDSPEGKLFIRRVQSYHDSLSTTGNWRHDEARACDMLRQYCGTLGGIYAELANNNVVTEGEFFDLFCYVRKLCGYSPRQLSKKNRELQALNHRNHPHS